ncbi:MAG: EAL domain-containing protein [Solirubrobacteraceae bacterium]
MTASAPGGPPPDAEASEFFRALVGILPAISYATSFEPGFPLTYVSPQVLDILGYESQQFLEDQTLWYRLMHPDDRGEVERNEHWIWEKGAGADGLLDRTWRMIAADGRVVWFRELERVIRSADGVPISTAGVLIDITGQREAEAALRSGEELNRSIVAALDEGVVVIDRSGRYAEANASAARISGVPVETILGTRAPLPGVDLYYEDGTQVTPSNARETLALREGVASREVTCRLVRADGTERWVSVNYQPLPGDSGEPPRGVVCSFVDITERRAAERQIADLAYHDPLTGLPNRALLEEHLALQLAQSRRSGRALALLYLDLDDFKLINDGFGHAAGDDLLRWVAARLQRRVRAGDLLARQGGDEFLLLAADLGDDAHDAAASLAADLAGALDERFQLAGAAFHVGVSIGISLFPDDARDADSLLRHADAAMYQAKRSGRGRSAVYTETTEDPRERLSRTSRLRDAIGRGELALHYQPIFGLPRLELRGLEALVRWRDPDRGLLAPAEFVPLAESTDLVDALGDWVVDEACRQVREWQAAGLAAPVGFNLSLQQLRRDGFAARLGARLQQAGVDPAMLTAEITESATSDPAVADHALAELHDLGLQIALDDFGAGYSSLDRVRRLPVSCVKIDRSFMAEIPASPDACAMVVAILGLARSLGLDAVAEGVETQAQLDFLIREECGFAQGFFLAPPVPAADVHAAVAAAANRRPSGAPR